MLLLRNPKRGGQGPIWAVVPDDDDDITKLTQCPAEKGDSRYIQVRRNIKAVNTSWKQEKFQYL
jgi:hypothetical protein